MRKLTDHIVEGDPVTPHLDIRVMDEPGAGGASHEYCIAWGNKPGQHASVLFQNGPIAETGVNGVTHEALLAILIDRLRSFEAGPFSCRENASALEHLDDALWYLKQRTRKRLERGVEGTHQT